MLAPEERDSWERDGFFIVRRFAERGVCKAMLERVSELCARAENGADVATALRLPEPALRDASGSAAERTSKLFRVHRNEQVFNAFCREPRLLELVSALLGPDLDCFLSQFIFKNPRALGQPWHQDAFYFPFDRRPQVGVWLAVTEATLENGPLWVLPGSHRERIHPVVPDRREHAQMGYVEIVDHDTSGAVPVLLEPGDVLLFHSHLMHKSTDNRSAGMRAAMVYHYGEAGTVDRTLELREFTLNDWLPVLRAGEPPDDRMGTLPMLGARVKPPFATVGLDHVVLRVRALEPALAFYTEVLDGRVERRSDALGLVQVRLGRSLVDLVPVDGALGKLGGEPAGATARNVDHFCLRIEPFAEEELRSHLRSHGIEVGDVGTRYGADGSGPSLYVRDPDGNTVELKGPPDASSR